MQISTRVSIYNFLSIFGVNSINFCLFYEYSCQLPKVNKYKVWKCFAESEGSPPFSIKSKFYLITGTYWMSSPNINTCGCDIAFSIIVGRAFED